MGDERDREREQAEQAERERAERRERADYHVEATRRRRAEESARAQVLVDQFVADATAAGLVTTELTAKPYSGRGRYRTGRRGWYLRRDQSLAVDVDGDYLVLVVPPDRWGRLRGVTVDRTDPPLQVGEGARDGESIALKSLLALRLAAADDFP
jgi:hypothetical protein